MSRRYTLPCLIYLSLILSVLHHDSAAQIPTPITNQPRYQFKEDDSVIRERTELVTLSVTVTDRENKPIVGLKREQFEVFEDKIKQQIEFFKEMDAPTSIAIVFDISGSMEGKIARARDALKAFVETSHPDDDYYLVAFNDKVHLRAEATDGDTLLSVMDGIRPNGNTALFDATYFALETLKHARHQKRAIIVISDGVDNRSRFNFRELRSLAKESDAQIYCIGIADLIGSDCGRLCRMGAQTTLENLAKLTGGKTFFPESLNELEQATSSIANELRRQYSIGYTPTSAKRDGQWRKIAMHVKPEEIGNKEPQFVVRTREGYYAVP